MNDRKEKISIIYATVSFFISLVMMVYCIFIWKESVYRFVVLGISVVLMIPAVKILDKYSSEKIIDVIKKVLGTIFEALGVIVNRVRDMFGITATRRGQIAHITDYKDETISVKDSENHAKKRYRHKKWRDMNNSEKIRYVYARRMIKNIKNGYGYDGSLTPAEHVETLIDTKRENESLRDLLGIYHIARYQTKLTVSDTETVEIKKRFMK